MPRRSSLSAASISLIVVLGVLVLAIVVTAALRRCKPMLLTASTLTQKAQSGGEVTASALELQGDDAVEAFIQQHPTCVVEVYGSWCGACRMNEPTVQRAARLTKVQFAKAEEGSLQSFCKAHDIKGFPTFIRFEDGKEARRIEGGGLSRIAAILDIDPDALAAAP